MKVNDILSDRPITASDDIKYFAASSIGVNTSNLAADQQGCGFDASTISPFGNIHTISGIFHNHSMGEGISNPPSPLSGILRFNLAIPDFEVSMNGGLSFEPLGALPGVNLQEAYNNKPNDINPAIILSANDLTIISNNDFSITNPLNSHPIFATDSTQPELNISGLIPSPITSHRLGDLGFLTHSQVVQSMDGVATRANQAARALGLGSLYLNTGSGLINIGIGSGINKYSSGGTSQTLGTVGATVIQWSTEVFSDKNYAHINTGANNPMIRMMSSGLYKCTYNVSWNQSSSANPITIKCDSTLNGIVIAPSTSYAFAVDSDHARTTNVATFLFNGKPGDILRIRAARQVNIIDSANIINGEAWVIVDKIGPQRQ